jgi:hypothetical protein
VFVNVCKLRVSGAVDAAAVARIRWELFVFPEIRVLPALEDETVAVLWQGAHADPARWLRALAEAGYAAGTARPGRLPACAAPAF